MRKLVNLLKRIYFWTTGYSYTNLGRLFLRLFVGIMMVHFGISQIQGYAAVCVHFPSVMGMAGCTGLTVMICIELVCALFIMIGLMMRIMLIPPFIAMIFAQHYLMSDYLRLSPWELTWSQPGYLPVMFMGIYFFLMLVGPGKISCDYFLSLHIIHADNRSESALEEV